MRRLWQLFGKESLLLLRDWHALALLFLMPAAFILVMSLALQGQFSARSGVHVTFYLVNHDASQASRDLVKKLDTLQGFTRLPSTQPDAALKMAVRNGEAQFLLVVPQGFGAAVGSGQPEAVTVWATPGMPAALKQLFQSRLREVLGRFYLERLGNPGIASVLADDGGRKLLSARTLYGPAGHARLPSSVQQNVPAWLLFAMFFIAIPLSTTWVAERQQGTYARLLGMGVPGSLMLLGKLVPYVVVNLVQVLLMLLVGIYLVPLLGGGQLTLGHAWGALVLMAVVASFAAVAYALLVANLVSTAEQATIFTGVANLLMAAVGGIMVPRFVMPHAMQVASQFSPMAWGLDGFLDIFLRGGGVAMVWGSAWKLIVFGCACLLVAGAWMHRRKVG